MGVNWQISGYPDNATPPGSALVLELWEQGDSKEVRIRFFAQTPEALHAPFEEQRQPAGSFVVTPQLTDPARTHKATAAQVTAPPVVGEARFSLEDFTQRVSKAVQNAPLAPQEVPPLRLRADIEADSTTTATVKPESTPGTAVAR